MLHSSMVLNKSVVASISSIDSAIRAEKLGADVIEFRIDLADEDAPGLLQDLKKLSLPVIITNRMKQEGGAWAGGEARRIQTLISLLPLADAVDIELRANKRYDVVEKARGAGKTVIISTHDFQKTPGYDDMMGVIKKSFAAGADIAKIAVMPNSLDDVLRLLEVTLHASLLHTKGICTVAMGEIGKHSRAVAPVYGSVMTYGYVDNPTAPGQLRVDELKYILKLFL